MDSRSHVCQTFPLRFGSWRSRFFCSQTRPGKLFCKTFLILSRSSDWRKGHPFQKFYFLSQTFKRLNWNSTRKSQTAPPSPGSPLASIITCRHRPAAPPAEQKVSGGEKNPLCGVFKHERVQLNLHEVPQPTDGEEGHIPLSSSFQTLS